MGRAALAGLGFLCLLPSCDGERGDSAALPEIAPEPVEIAARAGATALPAPTERERVLGPFLAAHWRFPLPPQGPAPATFSEAEASLDPATCGACHPAQYAQWQGSLHAGAFSPGFSGQLIEGALAEPGALRECQACHAPLAEQQPVTATGAPNERFDPALRRHGVVCAACHVRAHRRFGPPRRTGAPPAPVPAPHGGFTPRLEYTQSRFCAACHQFFDDAGVDGKPVENTFREWQASPQAARGETCQTCHMPDRAHLWRGIHDAETVRKAVPADLVLLEAPPDRVAAALVLAAEGVGHAFPTYVTPRVFLAIWQEDAAGVELSGTRREFTLGRQLDFATQPWGEVFDTRVAAGESVKLDYGEPRAMGSTALVGRVTVDPDFHYRGVFATLEGQLADPEARRRIGEAHRRSVASPYVLHERRVPLP